jgi:putative ABC transport system permease protein
MAQEASRFTTLLVSTHLPPDQMTAKLEERMAAFDREMPLYGITTLEKRILRTLEQPRFRTTLFSAFGLMAFLLAAFGVYSVTAFRVAQRTREIGIRMAIGAEPGHIRTWISSYTLRPVGIGLVLGVLISLAVSTLLAAFLYDTSPRDAASYAVTVAMFTAVAWIASVVPAHRAARQQPSITLRHD